MEQDNDLKYFVGLENVQHLLAVYGIEDCEPSGLNHVAMLTSEPHTLSKIINVGFATALKTSKVRTSKENFDEYEELIDTHNMYNFLKSCMGSEITLNGTRQGLSEGGKYTIKISSTLLLNKILSQLEGVVSNTSEADLIVASSINEKDQSFQEALGEYGWKIAYYCFAGYDCESLFHGKKYKSKLYSLIYDLLFLVFKDRLPCGNDNLTNEGYDNGGYKKYEQVRDWIDKSFLRKYPALKDLTNL